VKLGFLSTATSNAGSFGLSTGTTVSPTQVIRALVAAFNAAGGIDGHKITPVIASTDTGGADWETEYAAACALFTQDNHVAAVLGYSFAFFDSFESCLTKAAVPHLNDAYNAGSAASLQRYPMLFSLANPTWDRHYLTLLEGAVSTGQLTKSDKVGVLLSACAVDQDAWHHAALPYIKAQGLDIVDTETYGCTSGANDDAAVVAQITGSVLKLHSSGVNKVIGEGIPIILMSVTAQTQGWHPVYLVTSWTGGSELQGTGLMPAAQEAQVHGFGWLPVVDVPAAQQPPRNAAQLRCLALLKRQGVVPSQFNDFFNAYTTCDALFVYEAALRAEGGRTDATDVANAIQALGTTYLSPMTLDGRTVLGPTRHDAPAVYRPWSWSASCSCFAYTGVSSPMPS
jgi:hypothetical protein